MKKIKGFAGVFEQLIIYIYTSLFIIRCWILGDLNEVSDHKGSCFYISFRWRLF